MKFIAATLLLLLAHCTASKYLRQTTAKSSPCPDGVKNRFPESLLADSDFGTFSLLGRVQANGDSVFDLDKLRTALEGDEDWAIGKKWILKMKVVNDGSRARSFGFAGGGGADGGFLDFTAQPGETIIDIKDIVNASAGHTEFQYRGSESISSGDIKFSDICFAPKGCNDFVCPNTATAPNRFKLKADTPGDSDAECCERRMCKAENVQCAPASHFVQRADYDTRPGSTKDECCRKTPCPTDICANNTKWKVKPGTGLLGNTIEQCCVPKECSDWSCSAKWKKKADPENGEVNAARSGSTDLECCDKITCDSFVLPLELHSVFKMKENAETLQGNTIAECTEALMCKDHECPNNTQWRPFATDNGKGGSTNEQCCEKLMCNSFDCSTSGSQHRENSFNRQGQSDEECCELKFCRDYTCSDDTKWVHMADLFSKLDTARRGSSDEECCEMKFCQVSVCSPVTAWTPKKGIKSIHGSSVSQCCDQTFCGDFTCDTDDDEDGVGTKWYKRMDTNAFKWQGSTNEECCLPKYCSQYVTLEPTKWQRKPDKTALGSTDAECYDSKYCSEYCCVGDNMILKPESHTRFGSTDAECCLDKTTVKPANVLA